MPRHLLLLILLTCFSCRKKEEPVVPTPHPPVDTTGTTAPDCATIPPPQPGFPYIDSTADPYTNVTAFFYNPAQADEVIVVVEGTVLGANEMLNVNLRTGAKKHLAYLDRYLPSINKKGWIVYSTVEDNVYKIKANGDSLTQLTGTSKAHDPKWDRDGKTIFFLQDQLGPVGARLVRMTSSGQPQITYEHELPFTAVFRKSNRLLVQRAVGSIVTVYALSLDSASEKVVFTGRLDEQGETEFRYLYVEDDDKHCFWTNSAGIMRRSLETGKTDTLFKNCDSPVYARAMPSGQLNEIALSKHTTRVVSPYFLIHEYKAIEHNVALRQSREVKIFR